MVEETSPESFGKSAAEHFDDLLGELQGAEESCGVKTGWRNCEWRRFSPALTQAGMGQHVWGGREPNDTRGAGRLG
jgi:hypothetical protein